MIDIDVVDCERDQLKTTIKACLTQGYELLSMVFTERLYNKHGEIHMMFTLVFKKGGRLNEQCK